jgi:hypothetical protein
MCIFSLKWICQSVLEHIKSKKLPQVIIPPLYFEQIIENGRTLFDECGVWKSLFINPNRTAMVPCWKFNAKENVYNSLLTQMSFLL